MTTSRPFAGRVPRAALAALISAALAVTWLSTSTAHAAPADPCPAPFPVADLVPGMVANGLTVEKGNAADPFTATVLGVVDDGIASGLDLIIVETDSPAITRAGGIWAGMSGSPVYAADGRLIGAVAYSLSFGPSPIAGVTPAADMYQILSRPGAAAALKPAKTVALPATIKQRVVASGAATATEATAGLQVLPIPLGVSGVNPAHLDNVSQRLQDKIPGVKVYAAGAASAVAASPSDIFPGSNFAAAISYGDVTAAGIGTTTAVCPEGVLAFGHPFLFSGASTMSVHTAQAVYVQPDPTFSGFKVANPGGVVGTLDQDRLAGIRGQFGPAPAFIPISSDITSLDDGSMRSATTNLNVPSFVPDIAATHLLNNLDRVADRIGGGTAEIRWIIQGTRASGAPFSVNVRNRYANTFDVSFESIFDSLDQLFLLDTNPFEDSKITSVSYVGSIGSVFTQYSIESVRLRRPSGALVPVPGPNDPPLEVTAGSRLNLRVTLQPYRNIGATRDVDLSVVVPADTVGAFGEVNVFGGAEGGGFGDGGGGGDQTGPSSFTELLSQLRGLVTNDSVNATLRVGLDTPTGFKEKTTKTHALVDKVVVGQSLIPITVVEPRRARPGVVDGPVWKLRSTLTSGPPTTTFTFGQLSTDRKLMGDWDGNGTLTPAVFRNGTWFIRNSLTSTTSVTFTFGQAGDLPVAGDWDGDGRDTVGVFRAGRWLLRNSLSSGPADLDFTFGSATARPVSGDWNGDGVDSVGTFSSGSWQLRNSNSAGPASYAFTFGTTGDKPVAGEWDIDGRDEVGVYRNGSWRLRNSLSNGPPSRTFTFGGTTSTPVVWG
jgi:SpoIVB peptidase S55